MKSEFLEQFAPDPFFTLSSDMLCVVGPDGYFQRLNPRWGEVLGLAEAELKARPLLDFVYPEDRAATVLSRASFENRFLTADGTYRWLSWRTSGRKAVGAFYCVVHDVTDRKVAERRLAMQFAVTRALAGASSLADATRSLLEAIGSAEGFQAGSFWRPDEPTQELYCIDFWHEPKKRVVEFERISRRTRFPMGEGIPGRVFRDREAIWVPDVTRDERFHRAFWAAKEGLRAACSFPILADGEVVGVVELLGSRVREPDPLLREMMTAVGSQIGQFIKRKDAEDALKTAEARLRSVVAHAPIVLFVLDRDGRFVLSEGSGLDALGLLPGQVVGRSVFEVYKNVPQIAGPARRALAGEALITKMELPEQGLSYETRYTPVFDEAGAVVEVIGVAIDTSARKKMEAALRQSEARLVEADRLASIGTLAAGVAHEINNPLSYVLLNLDLVTRQINFLETRRDRSEGVLFADIGGRLRETRAGVDRVRLIVQDLRAFSRVDTERREPVDVHLVLDETLEVVSHEIRHRARLVREYAEVPPALATRSRLSQVFLNLLLNAIQSMSEGDADQHRIRVATSVDVAGRIVVEVADSGSGMAPEILGRIFEPFFTTKPAGLGTGLGLSICHGIINALGGEITVESHVGRGTTFRVVLLPAVRGGVATLMAPALEPRERGIVAPASTPPEAAPAKVRPERAMRCRIMVVDDEPVLANAIGRTLDQEFDVTVFSNGREAMQRLQQDQGFDVILCDLIMPEVTGMDLYEELQRMFPAVAERMIFMTGGTFTSRAREFLAKVPNPALDKPFDFSRLEALITARLSGA